MDSSSSHSRSSPSGPDASRSPAPHTSWTSLLVLVLGLLLGAGLSTTLALGGGTFGALLAGFAVCAGFLFIAQRARPQPTGVWLISLVVVVATLLAAAVAMRLCGRLDNWFSVFMLLALAVYSALVLAVWGTRRWFMGWLVGLGGLYLLLVVLLFAATAFEMKWSRFAGAVMTDTVRDAALLSFKSSAVTVLLAMMIGVPLGYLLSRYRFWGHTFVDTVLDVPIVLPPLVVGVALLIFFNTVPGRWINAAVIDFQHWINDVLFLVQRGFTDRPFQLAADGLVFAPDGVVLAQFVVAAAFGIRTIKATFDQIDPRIEAVARTLGASRRQAFFLVTLPMAWHGILAAAVMTWARAIGEFGPILIFCGTTRHYTEVLPTSIYLEFQVGELQASLAIALLMVLLAMGTLLVFKKLGGRFALS